MINWALLGSYVLSLLIMIVLPVVLVFLAVKRFKVSWWAVLAGVVAYALFYLSTMGVDTLLSNGTLPVPPSTWPTVLRIAIFGLVSGLLEEGIRWLAFKLLGSHAEKFGSAPVLGIAHAGAESIFYGVLAVGAPLFTYVFYNAGHQIAQGTPISTVQSMLNNISAFWAQPFYTGLTQGGVSLITLSVQILMAILIWKSITDRNFLWFVVAVIYEVMLFLFNSYLGQLSLPGYVTIATMFLILLINVYLSYRFLSDEMEEEEEDEEDEDDEDGEDEDDEDEDEDDEVESENTPGLASGDESPEEQSTEDVQKP